MPQLDFSTFLPQIFWLFISLLFLYIVLSRYALPRVSDVIEERKDIIAQDIDSAKEYSEESEKTTEELNLKLSEAKVSSQNLINKSLQDIKEDNEIKKSSLIKEINNKMKFNDGNPPSSNMNANNKSNDKKVQSTGVNDGEKINNVNDAVVSNIDGKDREDEDGDLI